MKKHIDDLNEIRSMMERSSRFISLSGLSGIFPGIFALIGAFFAYQRVSENDGSAYLNLSSNTDLLAYLVKDGLLVLFFSLIIAFYFTARQAKKQGVSLWGSTSKRLLFNMALPLVTGGLFCIILLMQAPHLVDAATLVFYGLAVINASKYTFDDIRYLGYVEVILGLLCGFMDEWRLGILFWALGFGVAHIVYGIVMYKKYDSR